MFERNDRVFKFWTKFIGIVSIVGMVLCVLAGIILLATANGNSQTLTDGILMIVVYPLAILINWALFNLIFSVIRDIKYIRNKLYSQPNESDSVIDKIVENQIRNEAEAAEAAQKSADEEFDKRCKQLATLKTLLDRGVITQDEFEEQKKKMLGK